MPADTPLKSSRETCWGKRDEFWACLDKHADQAKECLALRKAYEAACPATWVRHFDRKRKYEAFKQELAQAEKDHNDELKSMPTLRDQHK